jgi:hypothetical protein
MFLFYFTVANKVTSFLHAHVHMRAPHATAKCLSEFPNFVFAPRYARCARRTLTLHARGGCAAMFHLCTLALRRPYCALRARLPYLVPIAPMSVCTNLGLDQSSRLGANAGYVVLRAHLRAHECALAIANELGDSWIMDIICTLSLIRSSVGGESERRYIQSHSVRLRRRDRYI